jgi:predicted CXXCH cytochrome family protein
VVIAAIGAALLIAILGVRYYLQTEHLNPPPQALREAPRRVSGWRQLDVWWGGLPNDLRSKLQPSGEDSNIHPADYTGPQACQECHKANYDSWTKHSHSMMNALATPKTVKGDFSATAAISYRGGRATFRREGDEFIMRLRRGDTRRTYAITQTIGSRFFQYYVGKQIEGPEPKDHHFYAKDHVLPFGYWLAQKQWVPIVHIGPEGRDDERPDPFNPPGSGLYYAEYSAACNYCHTTFPLGDMLGRITALMGEYAPTKLHWTLQEYLEENRPEMVGRVAAKLNRGAAPNLVEMRDRVGIPNPMVDWEATQHAVTLGISCEACHLGGKAHVASRGRIPPRFFPSSPYLYTEHKANPLEFGRTHDNVNWACGRCHVGGRPRFAAGMATWNSVEYADAMRGKCYSQLRCVDCHNPHRTIGLKWSLSADADDALCLKCHDKFKPEPQRLNHTHHPIGSEGARCMNCHMPRINESMENVVRTHMIYSPTRADMIQANHPNACNLCHTKQPIDWTLRYLKEWYGVSFAPEKIAANYPDRAAGVALGWLQSDNPAVRLVGADALTRARDYDALPQLIDALDDSHLLNRQFALRGLQEMMDVRLSEFGYQFYMNRDERRQPLSNIRARLTRTTAPTRP